eukprot:6190658-Pleurochrysis_carterae.AAC.1
MLGVAATDKFISSIAETASAVLTSPYTFVSSSAMRPLRVRSARASLPCGRWSRFFACSAKRQPCPNVLSTAFIAFFPVKDVCESVAAMQMLTELIRWCKSDGARSRCSRG